MPPGFKEGLRSSFDRSNSRFSFCRLTARKLTHVFDPFEPLAPKLPLDAAFSKEDAGEEIFIPKN